MALATLLTSDSDTTNKSQGQSYTTASITPGANKLILAFVVFGQASASDISLSGNGLTWVKVNEQDFESNGAKIWLYRAMGASPSSGAVSIQNDGENTAGNAIWIIVEVDGVDTSGANGAGAIVQSNSAEALDDSGTDVSVALGAFASARNATFGAIGTRSSGGITEGIAFTELAEEAHAESREGQAQFRDDNDPIVDWTLGSATHNGAGMIAVEINAVGTVVPSPVGLTLTVVAPTFKQVFQPAAVQATLTPAQATFIEGTIFEASPVSLTLTPVAPTAVLVFEATPVQAIFTAVALSQAQPAPVVIQFSVIAPVFVQRVLPSAVVLSLAVVAATFTIQTVGIINLTSFQERTIDLTSFQVGR